MGLQTVDRAIELLRCLGNSGSQGLRLVEVQRRLGLTRPTAHRMLSSLVQYGMAVRDEASRCYSLGQEVAILGWSVTSRTYDLREVCQDAMHAIAERTGDTAILVVRSGHDSVCIDRRSGPFPIKVFTVDIGMRRPLGFGAGSIALLASLPETEVDAILSAGRHREAGYPASFERTVRRAVREAREKGYALSDGVVLSGVRGVGVVIRDFRGAPVAGIGIAATAARLPLAKVGKVAAMLGAERDEIERRLRGIGAKARPARA